MLQTIRSQNVWFTFNLEISETGTHKEWENVTYVGQLKLISIEKKIPVDNLQSHFILTMFRWSSGLPVCFPSQETQVQNPKGVLM
jgi:hypothetical protein